MTSFFYEPPLKSPNKYELSGEHIVAHKLQVTKSIKQQRADNQSKCVLVTFSQSNLFKINFS